MSLKLATISMTTGSHKQTNINTAIELVITAAAEGHADWILLPEIFTYHGSYADLYENAEDVRGALYQRLARLAKELNVVLFAGSFAERPPAGELEPEERTNASGERRVYNTMYVFGRSGEELGFYRKTHLFNLYEDDGRPLYCESDGYIPGDQRTVIDIDGYRAGLAICYDLRFPSFIERLSAQQPLDVLVIPAAFTKATGEAHWELLLKARAVEQQCYVLAANQTGHHGGDKHSFGHSMIIDPWGDLLADTGDSIGIAYATMSRERIAAVRQRLPALKNRRPELYR